MTQTENSRSEYLGFDVFTSLVSFDASGWTARYSIFFADGGASAGRVAHRNEVKVATHRIQDVLTAARTAAYRWIDESLSAGA